MRTSLSVWSVCPGAGSSGLRFLDDIGDLGTDNSRTFVQLGSTRAVWANDHIRFEGRDDQGKPWQALLPVSRGLGKSEVWQADFDRNSRQDLLFAGFSSPSGRCLDIVTLSFLMFDEQGRPVPWVLKTY